MSHLRKRWLLVMVVVLAMATASASMASQRALTNAESVAYVPMVVVPGEAEMTTTYVVPEAEQQKAAEFWTLEQRLAAKPLAPPAMTNADLTASPVNTAAEVPGKADGSAPAANADAVAQAEFADEWAYIEKVDLDRAVEELIAYEEEGGGDTTYGTRGVFTSYATNYFGNSWQQFPYRAVGRIFITGVGSCSGAVISPNNLVVTAAHCVYNRSARRFYPGWSFVPAYRAGAAPYGVWTAANATVLNNYITTGGMRYDVALIKLNTRVINGAARNVSYLTGNLGRSWNGAYTQHLHAQGYPSNLLSSNYSWTCAAESFPLATDVIGMGCNMTFGSSGGPWIRTFYPYAFGAVNYVAGVVSGLPGSEAAQSGRTFFGPRFSSDNIVILCNARGC